MNRRISYLTRIISPVFCVAARGVAARRSGEVDSAFRALEHVWDLDILDVFDNLFNYLFNCVFDYDDSQIPHPVQKIAVDADDISARLFVAPQLRFRVSFAQLVDDPFGHVFDDFCDNFEVWVRYCSQLI